MMHYHMKAIVNVCANQSSLEIESMSLVVWGKGKPAACLTALYMCAYSSLMVMEAIIGSYAFLSAIIVYMCHPVMPCSQLFQGNTLRRH